jgi:hypothetical protein
MNTPTPITEQHKALWTTLYNLAHDEIFEVASSDGPAHQLIADSEARAVAAITIERDHLHAQLRALTLICGTNDANKFETWIDRANARAERAEAELGKLQELHGCSQEMVVHWCAHAAGRSLGLDQAQAELAAERARLDWLESPAGFDWQWNSAHSVLVRRAAIDAGMKEDAK